MPKKKWNTEAELSAPIRVRLFGPLELENQWGRVAENPSRQSFSWLLLKYLLVNPHRGVTREELRENLWPDKLNTDEENVSRVRLHRLRGELRPLRLDGQNGLVLFQASVYRLNPACDIYSDADEFSELLAELRRIPPWEPAGLTLCGQALELFRGPFLASTHSLPWLESVRNVYRNQFCELARTALARMEALRDDGLAELLCRRTAVITPEDKGLCQEVAAYLIRAKKKSALGRFVSCLSLNHHIGTEKEESNLKHRFETALPAVSLPYEVNIRLFGQLELENQWGRAMENPSHPSFSWLLLKYLLVNAGREVPLEELLETIWPDKPNINTAYAANIRLRRLREALAPLKLQGRKGLVLFHDGLYCLNPDYTLHTDVEVVFDLLARQGDTLSPHAAEYVPTDATLAQGSPFFKHKGQSVKKL